MQWISNNTNPRLFSSFDLHYYFDFFWTKEKITLLKVKTHERAGAPQKNIIIKSLSSKKKIIRKPSNTKKWVNQKREVNGINISFQLIKLTRQKQPNKPTERFKVRTFFLTKLLWLCYSLFVNRFMLLHEQFVKKSK